MAIKQVFILSAEDEVISLILMHAEKASEHIAWKSEIS